MTLALIITTYNRPEYLRKCFDSILRSDIPNGTVILISDDCSDDEETLNLIRNFKVKGCEVVKLFHKDKKNIYGSLDAALDFLVENYEIEKFINLDSDAIIANNYFEKILELHSNFPYSIVTGFHCETKNADGSDRHSIIDLYDTFCTKKSVGGINMVFSFYKLHEYIYPALQKCIQNKGGNWDHLACINSINDGFPIVVSVPSFVQHIGINSSMGHSSYEKPDTADSFVALKLPMVTCVVIDCYLIKRAIYALDKSCKDIEFGDTIILTSIPSNDPRIIIIPPLTSKEEYSEFVIKNLHKYIKTEFALIVQHDGYVVNALAWDNEFLNYDYIGAPWWYVEGNNVGNGGFSLRSKKLLEATANLLSEKTTLECHPEDDVICRQNYDSLTNQGIKFAFVELAKKFSIEGWGTTDRIYDNQFGFHGGSVIFRTIPSGVNTIIINQFEGLGDIMFMITIARNYIEQGFKVLWPINPLFLDIQKHYPDIEFIDMNLLKLNYNVRYPYKVSNCWVMPFRYTDYLVGVKYKDCMKSKYMYIVNDWETWKDKAEIKFDTKKAIFLFNVLGIKHGEKFTLINRKFRSDFSGEADIVMDLEERNIEMTPIEGFTLMDWYLVIMAASSIHTVGTSIIYLLELLNLKKETPIHIYLREPDESNYENYEYIMKKHSYIFHH